MLYSVKVVVLSGLVMWVAMELRGDYWTVRLAHLEATLALIVKMLGSPATQVSYESHNCNKGYALKIIHRTKTFTIFGSS